MPGWPHHHWNMEPCVATSRIYALQKKSNRWTEICQPMFTCSIPEEHVKAWDRYRPQVFTVALSWPLVIQRLFTGTQELTPCEQRCQR